jgi:hypothetical protein
MPQRLGAPSIAIGGSPGVHGVDVARVVQLIQGKALRLLALPESCALHQFTVELLTDKAVAYSVVHQASGLAGLQ